MLRLLSLLNIRYLRARRRRRYASFVTLVSVLGIGLGVAVLIIVNAVMNGFEHEVRSHVLGMTSHAALLYPGKAIPEWQHTRSVINQHNSVAGSAPFVRGGAMLSHAGQVHGAIIQGLDLELENTTSRIAAHISKENQRLLAEDAPNLLLGSELQKKLNVEIGQNLVLIAPRFSPSTGTQSPKYLTFSVAGTFKIGMHEFDNGMAIMSLANAQKVFDLGDSVHGIRVKFSDASQAPFLARELASNLDPPAASINWTQYHRNFFEALKSQKRIMFVILSIIVAVAAFNIVASMIMLVREKHGDIAILRTLGMSRGAIMQLFVLHGTVIGLIGVAVGVVTGVVGAIYSGNIVAFLERLLGVQFIKSDVYYIDYLPAVLHLEDIGTIGATAAAISVFATIYPAWKASLTNPADALRFESAG